MQTGFMVGAGGTWAFPPTPVLLNETGGWRGEATVNGCLLCPGVFPAPFLPFAVSRSLPPLCALCQPWRLPGGSIWLPKALLFSVTNY